MKWMVGVSRTSIQRSSKPITQNRHRNLQTLIVSLLIQLKSSYVTMGEFYIRCPYKDQSYS